MTAESSLHICFVSPNLYPVLAGQRDIPVIGGAEFRQSMLARAFANAGHSVSVITQDFGQPDREVIDGVRVHKTHTPFAGIPGLRYFHPRLTSVMKKLGEVGADIYYQSTASHLTGVVAWHARRTGACSIYGGASDTDFMRGSERMRYARDRLLFRWGLAHVHSIVAQSVRQQALVLKHYQRSATVIPNPYIPPARIRLQRDDLVLWVGGIRQVKRPDRFISLARSLPQVRFRMIGGAVGEAPAAQEYFKEIEGEAAKVPNLEFLGFQPVSEVEQHFDEARIFVNTSEHEGFPNTFLQAWSRGIPTVSWFDAGTCADGNRAYRKVDSDTETVAAVRQLISDQVTWRELSERSRSHFAATHAAQSVIAAYTDLFGQHHGRAA